MPHLDFLRNYAGIPVTNVSSAFAAAEHYHQNINLARGRRISVVYINCCSGSLF